jgi:L-rhamnose-H+ transport protein
MQTIGLSGPVFSLLAGGIAGSTLAPLKRVKNWTWENWWLVVAACAYFFFPWIVAAFSVPHLPSVYRLAGRNVTLETVLLGMAWGFAVVLSGKALDLVGYSMSTALLYGSSVALGSLGALFLIDRSKLFSAAGLRILAWDIVLLVGVGFCAQAGRLRETALEKFRPVYFGQLVPNRSRTRLGIICALLAGVLSTLFNIVLANGEPIRHQAIASGADPNLAANAIWSLAVSAGSLPSIVWCAYLVTRRSNWSLYRKPHSGTNLLLCLAMGGLWITGTVLYGVSSARLGRLGPAISWPIFMSSMIIAGNLWGWAWGEWGGASPRSVKLLWGGIAVQILGIVLLSAAP